MANSFTRVWKAHKNKILALSFIGLGLLLFLSFYIAAGFSLGWSLVVGSFSGIWNFLITLLVYGYLFFTNLYNDNHAYSGIFAFIALAVFEAVFNIIDLSVSAGAALWNQDGAALATFVPYLALSGGIAGIGIPFYIFLFRYMLGRDSRFGKVRLFALLFLGILLLSSSFYLAYQFIAGLVLTWQNVLLVLALPISELCVGAGVVFTLERLRRI